MRDQRTREQENEKVERREEEKEKAKDSEKTIFLSSRKKLSAPLSLWPQIEAENGEFYRKKRNGKLAKTVQNNGMLNCWFSCSLAQWLVSLSPKGRHGFESRHELSLVLTDQPARSFLTCPCVVKQKSTHWEQAPSEPLLAFV